MARYRRVSLMEREELSRMLAAGSSLRAIGQALSRAPSTLSRNSLASTPRPSPIGRCRPTNRRTAGPTSHANRGSWRHRFRRVSFSVKETVPKEKKTI